MAKEKQERYQLDPRTWLLLCLLGIASIILIHSEIGGLCIFLSLIHISYISILSAQDPKSREFFQKLIGTRKVLKISNSENRKDVSRSINESRESIFQPEDFGNLDEKLIIYANGRYIKAEKIKCYE